MDLRRSQSLGWGWMQLGGVRLYCHQLGGAPQQLSVLAGEYERAVPSPKGFTATLAPRLLFPCSDSSTTWAPLARQPACSIHRPFQFAPLSSHSSLFSSYGRKELQMLSGPNNIHQSISRAEARIYTAARRAGNGLGFSKAASSNQSKPQDHGRTRVLHSCLCLPQKELI